MKVLEFGDKLKRKIILIHGFQMPYQIWNNYINHYKNDFHVVVPIMPGHYPNHTKEFTSFSKLEKEFTNYYIANYGRDVYAIYAMSMGGVLAATLWQSNRLKIEKIIFDSSPLIPANYFTKKLILQFYLAVTHKSQKRDQKTVKQAKKICPPNCVNDFLHVLDAMTDATIQNYIEEVLNFQLPDDLDTKNTKIYYFCGTAINELLAKKSAKFISQHYKNSIIISFKGKSHCENMLFHPQRMIEELDSILI